MPKVKMIRCSEEILIFLKEYQKEFGFSSLEEAIENAVKWARLWNYVDARTRRDMQKQISDLEFRVEALENRKS